MDSIIQVCRRGGVFLLVLYLSVEPTNAQSCSCAGAPLIDSQTLSSVSRHNLLLGISAENNAINDIYSGDDKIDRQNIRRTTQTLLLEANYGITERLTASGTFTFIKKRRETGLQTSNSSLLETSGIGDGMIMLKYVLHRNTMSSQYQLAIGGGAKIPIGASDLTNGNIQLNADMQPGTGAWDGIAWSYISKTFAPVSSVNLFWINSVRITGRNERFRGSTEGYKFGNEMNSMIGARNTLRGKFSYLGILKFRYAAPDQLGGEIQPNTGGFWVQAVPGINYGISRGMTIRFSGTVPLYQYLNGLQPTTSWKLTASLFFNLNQKTVF